MIDNKQFLYIVRVVNTNGYFNINGCKGSLKSVCKIGIANDVSKRFKNLKTSCPFELELHRYFRINQQYGGARELESIIHSVFDDFNLNGEWFMIDNEILNLLIYHIDHNNFRVDYEYLKYLASKARVKHNVHITFKTIH